MYKNPMRSSIKKKLTLAVPKGRILKELLPILKNAGIEPEDDFFNDESRSLQFTTNHENLVIIRVRAFDVASFVAFGAAQIGIAGSDVIEEFDYDELYEPLDLKIGTCRLSLAAPETHQEDPLAQGLSHIKIATKYPNLTSRYFKAHGIQTECIKLSGAMEVAPRLGLANHIVDLVSTGSTLKANHLKEVRTLCEISSKLIVNRSAMKTRINEISDFINSIEAHIS